MIMNEEDQAISLIQEMENLITTVHRMREFQKRYHRNKDPEDLKSAKYFEKRVDCWIQAQLKRRASQRPLFG